MPSQTSRGFTPLAAIISKAPVAAVAPAAAPAAAGIQGGRDSPVSFSSLYLTSFSAFLLSSGPIRICSFLGFSLSPSAPAGCTSLDPIWRSPSGVLPAEDTPWARWLDWCRSAPALVSGCGAAACFQPWEWGDGGGGVCAGCALLPGPTGTFNQPTRPPCLMWGIRAVRRPGGCPADADVGGAGGVMTVSLLLEIPPGWDMATVTCTFFPQPMRLGCGARYLTWALPRESVTASWAESRPRAAPCRSTVVILNLTFRPGTGVELGRSQRYIHTVTLFLFPAVICLGLAPVLPQYTSFSRPTLATWADCCLFL